MGDSEWHKVTQKKHRSVFKRLKFPQLKTSMVDDLANISLSIYVSNFPSHLTIHELWNICSKRGTLVDVYIAKHKNKLGQMFAFCRYIKVSSSDTLIDYLNKVWIENLCLHANVARFDRDEVVKASHANVKVVPPVSNTANTDHNASYYSKANSYANVAKAPIGGNRTTNVKYDASGVTITPPIKLKQTVSTDFPLAILGCYKDFRSIENTRTLCQSEGFLDVEFKYLGGLWVLFKFSSLDARNKFLKHEGILSCFSSLKPWHDDFVVCKKWGEVLFIDDSDKCNRLSKRICIKSSHAMLVFATILVSFNDVTYAIRVRELCSWTPTFLGGNSNNDEDGSMGSFYQEEEELPRGNDVESIVGIIDDISEVKADLEQVLQSKDKDSPNDVVNDITPLDSDPVGLDSLINRKCGKVTEVKYSETPEFPPGFSPTSHSYQQDNPIVDQLLDQSEETIKVGLALGLNMKGCENTLAALIAKNGDLILYKKLKCRMLIVDAASSRGNSHFDFASTSARGISGGIICIWNNLLFKKSKILSNENFVVVEGIWTPIDDGILVMMGDFNEVREAGERFGSIFNERQAQIFNAFIANTYLIDIPLGGVVLKKGIPDHRPILLKEYEVDYGLTPFWFFHSWMEIEGFHKLVVDTWKNDDHLEAKDIAQKAKIKWAMQGDENTSFFHGTLKKKRRQLAIKGVLKNGSFPKGCNSSFIALIPKVSNAKFVIDFRPISLIGCQYKIIGKILANRLSTVIGSCISAEQSAFVKGRNILDGPLVLNEVIDSYRKCKKELMIYKVDFEKAFDSLRWDFLDMIMDKLGFGLKWRSWIYGCLQNAHSSVLVNGSPSIEFETFRGLRQGDPLSPFLFILAMEGVCVFEEDVSDMANAIGCGAAKLPLKYLGVPIGCNMARCSNWNVIIQKFSSKLSQWKAKLLSVGGRLSLIKSVLGNLPTYYMSIYMMPVSIQYKSDMMRNHYFIGGESGEKKTTWVKWKKCLASKKFGGLGIGSIFALNIGLLFKWIWRSLSQPSDLWVKVIKNIYGLNGGIFYVFVPDTDRGCNIANRLSLPDWGTSLRRKPNGGVESCQFLVLQTVITDVVLSDEQVSWQWSLNVSVGFSVSFVRSLIDAHILDVSCTATRWNPCIPIKVNVFLWRLLLNKLPSRVNLDRKGIDVVSILCPICQEDVETANHIFFTCEMAKEL
ncbi:RNA-directed DNA polymerase, eukaryota, reverse transcriptase zinc-binding domain protein [Tanacetum coccineum]